MPFPKLSPLQSQLAASLMAMFMLLMLYLVLSLPQFAYAADERLLSPREDHNHAQRLQDVLFEQVDLLEPDLLGHDLSVTYEAEFLGADRSIIGRAPNAQQGTPLINNRMELTNVPQGMSMQYVFLNSSLWGPLSPIPSGFPSSIDERSVRDDDEDDSELERDGSAGEDEESFLARRATPKSRVLYISVNTCVQPGSSDTDLGPPPQLELYISQSPNNTLPGPGMNGSLQQMTTLEGGATVVAINATGNVYIGLAGQNTTNYEGVWSAQIAASIDAPYHYYNGDESLLFLVDSDSSSALLITDSLTDAPSNSTEFQEWMDISPLPFVVFASSQSNPSIAGLQNSYCGLLKAAEISPVAAGGTTQSVQMGMTSRGSGLPKEQFYFDGLQANSSYYGILAMNGNSTDSGDGVVGGGGQVWKMMNFTTLTDGNCAVIFDLSFCTETAYAVPGNPQNFPNFTSLAAFYDNATQAQYQFFENVLAQIPCETTSSAQYSLAKTCEDCASAYKEWLCSVTIPRCTDFSSTLPWLRSRNMGQSFPNGTSLSPAQLNAANSSVALNSSRNPNIDLIVQPGPYKEVLPCDYLCYEIVKSCPSSMGFACPLPAGRGFNESYGLQPDNSPEQIGQITCNYPGAAFFLSAAGPRSSLPSGGTLRLAVVTLSLMIILFV